MLEFQDVMKFVEIQSFIKMDVMMETPIMKMDVHQNAQFSSILHVRIMWNHHFVTTVQLRT